MNPSGWRKALAEQIVLRLERSEGLRAFAVAGSVARGYADEYSDLELAAFWEENPSPEKRKTIIESLDGASFASSGAGPSAEDNFLINGFQVDLWHNEVAYEQTVVENVLKKHSTNLSENNFLETVQNCIPILGIPLISEWKHKAQHYPEELGRKFAEENIGFFHCGNFEIHLSRGDLPNIYNLITGFQKRIFLTLLGLNKAFFPTFKWMMRTFPKLKIRPSDIEGRFLNAFRAPPDRACEDIQRLMSETLDLVDHVYPGLSTESARERLKFRRAKWVRAVSLNDRPSGRMNGA